MAEIGALQVFPAPFTHSQIYESKSGKSEEFRQNQGSLVTLNESEIHRFIKNEVANALEKLGYSVRKEARCENEEGRLDILAKKGYDVIKVEVYKTHVPEWIVVKVGGDIGENPSEQGRPRPHKTAGRWGIFFQDYCIGLGMNDGTILCMLCAAHMESTEELEEHLMEDHYPIDWSNLENLKLKIPEA